MYSLSLAQPDHAHSPQKTTIFERAVKDFTTSSAPGLKCSPTEHRREALQPNHVRPHHDQEKHIVDSLIENMWKACYQKDSLQSLKQNASIKYIIYCFQV